jgi:hypothetical protein
VAMSLTERNRSNFSGTGNLQIAQGAGRSLGVFLCFLSWAWTGGHFIWCGGNSERCGGDSAEHFLDIAASLVAF